MKNKSTIISFIISFIVVGSLIAVFTWNKTDLFGKGNQQPAEIQSADDAGDGSDSTNAASGETAPTVIPDPEPPQPDVKPFDPTRYQGSPSDLANAIIGVIRNINEEQLEALVASKVLDRNTMDKIKKAAASGRYKLNEHQPLTEIGSWDSGNQMRYRINFTDGTTGIVDLVKDQNNLWQVQNIIFPEKGAGGNVIVDDALGVAERFVTAVLGSDFATASSLLDHTIVSNATLAGLCILFEEGDYHLRKQNPVKGMFMNDDHAGFLIYLEGRAAVTGNMGLSLKRSGESNWLISEISLDSLLASFVKEVAKGEEIYVPLVKNPQGGDSLVLFFGFNEDTLTPRSMKQLEIVAKIIRVSPDKKLEISGHTDDIGGNTYNQGLSERRAAAVKAALVSFGVPEDKIQTVGLGKSSPRRTYGSSDPEVQKDEARRLNRRAEMYLDF